ncbi:MAG: outer membrane beta-barrel protein [Alphaproteobacteria bacterium]
MNWRKTNIVMLVLLLTLALATPAMAAKKKKKKKKKKQDRQEQTDPWAGRFGLSVSGGGVSSGAGFGFEGRVGLTYYFNQYFSTTLAPGFGTYPIEYDDPVNDNETETVYVKYIPTDLSVTITPIRYGRYTPYFGPGVGMTYFWWTEKVEDEDNPGETVDEDQSETYWSAFVSAGVSVSMGGPFVASFGLTYRLPDLSDVDFSEGIISFGFGGGVVF